jgi:hypothetical protein
MTTNNNILEIPDGYTIIANRVALMLVKTEQVGNNPGVHAACYIQDGEQELLRRFYATQDKEVNEDG